MEMNQFMNPNPSVLARSVTAHERDRMPKKRVPTMLLFLRIALITVLAAVANTYGAWYGTWIVALLSALVLPKRAVAVAALAGAFGWGLPLLVTPNLLRAASVVVDVMGIGTSGTVLLALTIVWGAVLGVCGAWAGIALRRLWAR